MTEELYQSDEHQESSEQVSGQDSASPNTSVSIFMHAGFWVRFWAYLVDLIVVGSLSRLVLSPLFALFGMNVYEAGVFSPVQWADTVVYFLYFVLMTKYFNQTLGKMVFGIKVVSSKEGALSWGQVLFRELVVRYIYKAFFFLNLLYLWVAFHSEKKGIHDIVGDTEVILQREGIVKTI